MTGNVGQKLRREEKSEDINLITKYMEFKSLDCQGMSRRKCKEKKNKFKDKDGE